LLSKTISMKQEKKHFTSWICAGCLLFFVVCGCTQQHNDVEIKKDLTAKAKNNKEFIGVRFIVDDGIVTLSGVCPTEKERNKVVSKVKGTYAVKEVINHISIAPVVIGTDEQLKQGVDSVLKVYPGVQAIVKDSTVQLQGQADSKDEQKLLISIKELGPKQLNNEVVFKGKE